MALPRWQGASFTSWLPTSCDCPESCHPAVLRTCEEENAGYTDSYQHSDADQNSMVLRKRHCDDLAELESSSWDTEGQQQLPDTHSLKRVCSGLNSSFAEGHSEQPVIPSARPSELHSEPCSPGTHSADHTAPYTSSGSMRPLTPTGSSPATAVDTVAAVAAASSGAYPGRVVDQDMFDTPAAEVPITRQHRSSSSLAAGTWQVRQELGSGPKAVQAADDSNTRTTAGSRSRRSTKASTAAAGGQPGAATTSGSSKLVGRRPRRHVCESSSQKSTMPGAQKACSKKSSSSSSTGVACKGPRVRLGGRVLSPEEAEKYLKEVAAAAAKAAATKAAIDSKMAAGEDATANALAATAVMTPKDSRAASPSLDAICKPAAAAECPASPQLLISPHASSLSCQLDPLEDGTACTAPVVIGAGLAVTTDPVAVDSLACDDLDLTDQLQEHGQILPHMDQFGWPALDATMGADIAGAAAAAAAADQSLDAVIGSAGSAAGDCSSLAAAVQADEAEPFTYHSPFQLACPAAVKHTPTIIIPANSMHSHYGSSASLNVQTSTPQPPSSMYSSSCMPIRLGDNNLGQQQPRIWDAAARAATPHTTVSNLGLGRSGSASLSGVPDLASSPGAVANMSCNSLSSLAGLTPTAPVTGPTAAEQDAAAAAAAEATAAAAAAAAGEAAAKAEASADAELQQLLAQWSPGLATPGAAASAPAGMMHSSTAQQQQQQQHMLAGLSAPAMPALNSMIAAPRRQQQQQLVWKPAFPSSTSAAAAAAAAAAPPESTLRMPLMPPPAAVGSTCGTNNVRIQISSNGVASLIASGRVPSAAATAAASAATVPGRALVASAAAAVAPRPKSTKQAPRAKKSKRPQAKQADLQQQQQQPPPLQFQMQMQQVPASTAEAEVPQTRIVVHLKPNQQQQLMAMVDRIVQQRLVQSYEAGFRAASQLNAMGVPAAAAAASVDTNGLALQAPAAVAAAAASADVPSDLLQLAGGAAGGFVASDGQAAAKRSQLVDDILPSMQDLLSDI